LGTDGTGGAGGGANGSDGAGIAATVNTGGGGGAGGNTQSGGTGGSGIVILKYPDSYTITVGAGLTANTPAASGGFKVTTFTAGTDTISFS
jgi:hypothetical protein